MYSSLLSRSCQDSKQPGLGLTAKPLRAESDDSLLSGEGVPETDQRGTQEGSQDLFVVMTETGKRVGSDPGNKHESTRP